MNLHVKIPMTVDEYLVWAQEQPELGRCELINGVVVQMSPERAKHWRFKGRMYRILASAFEQSGIRGEVAPDGATVRIDDHTAYEPDALIYLGNPVGPDDLTIPNPVILVEVLSHSTRHTDLSGKLVGYFSLPSVVHYLIVDPNETIVTHYVRGDDGPAISGKHRDGSFNLDPPGLTIDISGLFDLPS